MRKKRTKRPAMEINLLPSHGQVAIGTLFRDPNDGSVWEVVRIKKGRAMLALRSWSKRQEFWRRKGEALRATAQEVYRL